MAIPYPISLSVRPTFLSIILAWRVTKKREAKDAILREAEREQDRKDREKRKARKAAREAAEAEDEEEADDE